MKRPPLRIAVLIEIIVILVLELLYNTPGSGFGAYIDAKGEVVPAKTLWDWLSLLIVPLVLAAGGIAVNFLIQRREEQQKKEREEHEEKETAERAERERKAADDQLQEQVLQGYLDRMSELLLAVRFDNPDVGDEVKTVARARTLTVLRRIGGKRKAAIFQFLYEAKLITGTKPIIDLSTADFSQASLAETYLIEVNLARVMLAKAHFEIAHLERAFLEGAFLFEANLEAAELEDANLSGANLVGAKLEGANLVNAKLARAHLDGASLQGAILQGAKFEHATLDGANLTDAIISWQQLQQARSYKDAILPEHLRRQPASSTSTPTEPQSSAAEVPPDDSEA